MVYKVQEPQINFLFSDESSTVFDRADINKNIGNDPSPVLLDFHETVQNLQHKSSFLSLVDDFFNYRIELGDVEKYQKGQLLSQVVFPFLEIKNQGFNKPNKLLLQRLTGSEVDQGRQTYFGEFLVADDLVHLCKKISANKQLFGFLCFCVLKNSIKSSMLHFNFGLPEQINKLLSQFRS
jgi:hypothetical protein